ncbi:MAG: Rpn family recombination-promoting nuclease/putative transposase [Treponema sp.]|nr:Rpn family recombination-promoting nuclease/putative transposase [Treponema sp.]
MGANTKYKASVFSLLFSDPDLLRELYCALEGVSLPPDVPVTINTLEDALFLNRVNDISFEIGGKLVILIEHQSTINPNMALRLLLYIARVYEKMIKPEKIYTSQRILLPRPEFFVLYNGTAPFPDAQILKLSDAFEKVGVLGLPEKESPALELAVKAININHGKNETLVKKCKILAQYSAFVAKTREFENKTTDRAKALALAINHCRENDILKEFLEKTGTEVINMLFAEWNLDDALAVRFKEGREEREEEIARNALAQGLTPEVIQSLTGLSLEAINNLQAG